ncbi:uncharacterized protein [Arachis hypogaea]|uniref:uncharacterized protein n=1 Tax=Arachis hypogaea TaxID=3818 RepID=UPI003B21B3E2
MGDEKKAACLDKTRKLLAVGFIKELRFTTWLSNVIMVDNALGFGLLSFLDAYSGYNKILMHPKDEDKTTFNTELGKYGYKVMLFGLKNSGATYQRLMNKVFNTQIGQILEVYVDDMVISANGKARLHLNNHGKETKALFSQQQHRGQDKLTFKVDFNKIRGIWTIDKWSIELSEFDIKYKPRTAIKTQFLANFIVELAEQPEQDDTWHLYVDGALNIEGSGAGVLLTNNYDLYTEQSICFTFPTSNNHAEYEALLAGLRLAQSLNITHLQVYFDSLLVVEQVTGHFQVRDQSLEKYFIMVKELISRFNSFEITHIAQEHNTRADALSNLATTKKHMNESIISQLITVEPSFGNKSGLSVSQVQDWRTQYRMYLQTGSIPIGVTNPTIFKRRVASFTMAGDELYKRGFSQPLLSCLDEEE